MFVYKLLTFSIYYDLLKKKRNLRQSCSVAVGLGFHLCYCSIPNLGMCVSCVYVRVFLAVLTTLYYVFASPVVWL